MDSAVSQSYETHRGDRVQMVKDKMFTVDYKISYNSPCNGYDAGTSSDSTIFSSTALCASTYTFFDKGLIIDHINYVADDRSKAMASRLVQLCDDFDREFFQTNSSSNSSTISLLWRWLF